VKTTNEQLRQWEDERAVELMVEAIKPNLRVNMKEAHNIADNIRDERLNIIKEKYKEPTTLYLGGQEYHDLLSSGDINLGCKSESSGDTFEGLKIKRVNKTTYFELT
jgi:hypothetical protein